MTYAGLTISDKPALMEAQKNGHTYIYLDHDGFKTVYNVNLALAQIAEMEGAEKPKGCSFCCYTEYPDATLYPRDRSEFYAGRSRQVRVDCFDEDELNEVSYCPNCGRNLNSPYTEGATK